jgi:hypothetical protein
MKHQKTKNIHTATEGERSLPRGEYLGFAVGPESVHEELLVSAPGLGDMVIKRGEPLLLDGVFSGVPTMRPLSLLVHHAWSLADAGTQQTPLTLTAGQSPAHLIGIECPKEVPACVGVRLAQIRERLIFDSDAEESPALQPWYQIPIAGREQAILQVRLNGITAYEVHGMNYEHGNANGLLGDPADRLEFTGGDDFMVISQTALLSGTAADFDIAVEDFKAYDHIQLWIGDGTALSIELEVRAY